uniref:Solute carrier family 25 member 36 n=1 Tax=Syphacia muris TaxID=451379 RepID=A0A0N5ALV1_9BILA
MDREALIHFLGGAAGGTAGTAITCPLEVVKTRLQSSSYASPATNYPSTSSAGSLRTSSKPVSRTLRFRQIYGRLSFPVVPKTPSSTRLLLPLPLSALSQFRVSSSTPLHAQKRSVLWLFRRILVEEGFGALYKGLGPNVIGVAPSKAVYFYSYSSCKRLFNEVDVFVPNSAIVHMVSAASAGFIAATAVNPIWLVKTRLQLHKGPLTILECIKRVFRNEGITGFYRGVTASYVGISETVIQFVIYEHLRNLLLERGTFGSGELQRSKMDFVNFMVAGGSAKFIACVVAYPHEVVRTRLREEHSRARGFFSTLFNIYRVEGFNALYRGLAVQLMRTVPNTAITMGMYELIVYLLHHI